MRKFKLLYKLIKGSKQNSGMILLIVLWILTILSILAIGLSRQTNLELVLTKNAIAKAKAKYYAFAGIAFALNQIKLDSLNSESLLFDNLYYCAIPNSTKLSLGALFKSNEIDSGYFSIAPNRVNFISDNYSEQKQYGFTDEDGKINLNAININTYSILKELIILKGFDGDVAKRVSHAVVDWIDLDTTVNDEVYGAENEYYSKLDNPYRCKNLPFDSKEELLLIRSMTPLIFQAIKNYITVLPNSARFYVNFNTASAIILKAITRTVTGPMTGTDISDADSAVEALIAYRNASDGLSATQDDLLYDLNKINLNAKEKSILRSIVGYVSQKSDFININVVGVEAKRNVKSSINVIVKRSDLSFVFWNRD